MPSVVGWVRETHPPGRLFFVGQTAGLLPNGGQVDAKVTLSSQSGYWRLQGGNQKPIVGFHLYFILPLLSHLFGCMPWSEFSSGEDLP